MAQLLPAIPARATRGAPAQKSASSCWSPGGYLPIFLEYSEPAGFQAPRDAERPEPTICVPRRAGRRRELVTQARAPAPVPARGRAQPREPAQHRLHFYPSAAKNSRRAPSGSRNSGPQIRQDDSALPGNGRGGSGGQWCWAHPVPAVPTASWRSHCPQLRPQLASPSLSPALPHPSPLPAIPPHSPSPGPHLPSIISEHYPPPF